MLDMENRVIEYRVDQLEKTTNGIVKSVGSMGDKVNTMYTDQELIKQRIGTWTVGVGLVVNLILALIIQYFASKDSANTYTEAEKKLYYEAKVRESEIVQELRAEIERLKKNQK